MLRPFQLLLVSECALVTSHVCIKAACSAGRVTIEVASKLASSKCHSAESEITLIREVMPATEFVIILIREVMLAMLCQRSQKWPLTGRSVCLLAESRCL